MDVGGIFGSQDYGTARVNGLVGVGIGIPLINSGDFARNLPDNLFGSRAETTKLEVFQIFSTAYYNTFRAVLDTLIYFNWTLVGNIFIANAYGYNRQRSTQEYAKDNAEPIFACNFLFDSNEVGTDMVTLDKKTLTEYCVCVSDKHKISVTVLWMSTNTARFVIEKLQVFCPQSKDWTFIVSDDSEPDFFDSQQSKNPKDFLKNSLLIRSFDNWDFTKFLTDCIDSSSQSAKLTIYKLLDEYTMQLFNCQVSPTNDIPECTSISLKKSKEPCHCDIDVLKNDPYIVK